MGKISHALESFRRLQTENYELLKDLPESAFERTGTHSKDGPMSLHQVVDWYAQHLESHVTEIVTSEQLIGSREISCS